MYPYTLFVFFAHTFLTAVVLRLIRLRSSLAATGEPRSPCLCVRNFSNFSHFKVCLVTCSGIGRAVALAYAREGADIVISYLNEHEDAKVRGRGRAAFN